MPWVVMQQESWKREQASGSLQKSNSYLPLRGQDGVPKKALGTLVRSLFIFLLNPINLYNSPLKEGARYFLYFVGN